MSEVNLQYVALVGPPNSGKTTLFNWITGRRQKVVNYPGSTVDISMGPVLENLGGQFYVVDTPGVYSLFPKSQDEEVAKQALYDRQFAIKKVIVVIDSTQLSRQVHLVRQLQEAGFAVIVAVTMHDIHVKEHSPLDLSELAKRLGAPVYPIDGTLGGGVRDLVLAVAGASDEAVVPHDIPAWSMQKLQDVFREGEFIQAAVAKKELAVFGRSEKRDQFFLHPLWGPLAFVMIMLALFSSIYWAAAPVMDLVDGFFSATVDFVKSFLGDNMLSRFLADGVVAGLGAVLVFVPQIFILFVGIALLEDSGYLARAAALVDRPLSKIGLNGKAFISLLSGFACAVPAMMAARAIHSKKERWIATFIIPFMTCSARLPVYALLIGFVFGHDPVKAGALMATMYVGAILVGAVAAGLLSRIVPARQPSFLLLELPIYRRPKLAVVLRNSFNRTKSYVIKTGPIILVLSVALWALSTFPNYQEENAHKRLEASYVASLGHILEPVFRPMGVDGRVGVGLLSAFAAREVFVSSLAVMFNVTQVDDEQGFRDGLIASLRQATFSDGKPLFTTASVASLLVFFMLALQCLSTVATARQEMNSSRFAIIQLISMNLLAYVAAVITYSVMS